MKKSSSAMRTKSRKPSTVSDSRQIARPAGDHQVVRSTPDHQPDFRATITGDRITLVTWHCHLWAPHGPAGEHFRRGSRRRVVGALEILRDDDGEPDELIVTVLSGSLTGRPRQRLIDWAATLGYTRAWLPDAIVDLTSEPRRVGGLVEARCPTCRYRCTDGHPDFWAMVRSWGHFPLGCPMCGGDLPQWVAVE